MSMWQGRRIQEVDATDASAGRDRIVLLDVRNADEWAAGHAPGAIWVPLDELAGARFSLPINRRIVCVCKVGGRSRVAAAELEQMGFETANLTGGMVAWAEQGLPVVCDDGSPGHVL